MSPPIENQMRAYSDHAIEISLHSVNLTQTNYELRTNFLNTVCKMPPLR
jgi:hypothetical protein